MPGLIPNPFRVIVLGAGVAGLSAAHTICQHSKVPCQITVLEQQKRVGGWLMTKKLEDGSIVEQGPRGIRGYGMQALETLKVVSELGLDKEVIAIPRSNTVAKQRYVYGKGKINKIPSSAFSLIFKREPFKKALLPAIVEEIFVPKCIDDDESVYSFFQRRFNREIADYLADPLCRGVFGGDAKALSIKSCFPPVHTAEQEHGSVIRGMLFGKSAKAKSSGSESILVQKARSEKWMMWTLRDGMASFPEAWKANLEKAGVRFMLDTACSQVEARGQWEARVHTDKGVLQAEHVISSLPLFSLSSVLTAQLDDFHKMCHSVPYADMCLVTLEYKGDVLPPQYRGFGFLVPSCEPLNILGMTFDSCFFPDHSKAGNTILTAMLGGAWFRQLFGDTSTADVGSMAKLAVDAARDCLKISCDPFRVVTTIQEKCIPQYGLHHEVLVQRLRRYVKEQNVPLTLVGTLSGGVGVNDVILNSKLNTLRWLSENHLF